MAQFERELIREWQREGIALARSGVPTGVGKRSLTPSQAKDLLRRVAERESKTLLAKELGVTRDTIYRYMAPRGKCWTTMKKVPRGRCIDDAERQRS